MNPLIQSILQSIIGTHAQALDTHQQVQKATHQTNQGLLNMLTKIIPNTQPASTGESTLNTSFPNPTGSVSGHSPLGAMPNSPVPSQNVVVAGQQPFNPELPRPSATGNTFGNRTQPQRLNDITVH